MSLTTPAHAADFDEGRYTLMAGAGIVSPPSFDFDRAIGSVIAVGYMPVPYAGVELELMEMRESADSDQAMNLDQEPVAGLGPSRFEARTASLSLVGQGALGARLFYRMKVGFSRGDYRMARPAVVEERYLWGLSYGAGLGLRLDERWSLMLDANFQSHLVESGVLGVMVSW